MSRTNKAKKGQRALKAKLPVTSGFDVSKGLAKLAEYDRTAHPLAAISIRFYVAFLYVPRPEDGVIDRDEAEAQTMRLLAGWERIEELVGRKEHADAYVLVQRLRRAAGGRCPLPSDDEVEAFCDRLEGFAHADGRHAERKQKRDALIRSAFPAWQAFVKASESAIAAKAGGEWLPARCFHPSIAKKIRKAAQPNRKRMKVAARKVVGEVRYNVREAKANWPSPVYWKDYPTPA